MSTKRVRTNKSTVIGIDVGTTKVAALFTKVNKNNWETLGMATEHFDDSTSDDRIKLKFAIMWAFTNACKDVGCLPQLVNIGISGIEKSFNVSSGVRIEYRVSDFDIQSSLNIDIPEEMALLEQVVNSFNLNGNCEEKIDNPHGMEAEKLNVEMHNIFARKTMKKYVVEAVNKLEGPASYNVTSSEVAAAEILLTKADKQNGACLLDIGGEYSTLVIYHTGALEYSASFPWGGNHLNDKIKFLIGRNVTKAEQAKIAFSQGRNADSPAEWGEVIRTLVEKELMVLCSYLDTELCKSGLEKELKAGIVLTGGSSSLIGLQDTIEREFQLPVRRAQIPDETWLNGLPLEYASALGLAVRGMKLIRGWQTRRKTTGTSYR